MELPHAVMPNPVDIMIPQTRENSTDIQTDMPILSATSILPNLHTDSSLPTNYPPSTHIQFAIDEESLVKQKDTLLWRLKVVLEDEQRFLAKKRKLKDIMHTLKEHEVILRTALQPKPIAQQPQVETSQSQLQSIPSTPSFIPTAYSIHPRSLFY